MIFWDVLGDALLDSLKMLPFLFGAYWVIEWIEQRHSEGIERALARGGRWGFVPGAVLGIVPQCGFSAMAANLYASKVITLGTLLSVFLVTSDEAVPLLIASPEHWRALLGLLGIKLGVGLAAGFLIDFVLKSLLPVSVRGGYAGRGSAEVDCHEHDAQDGILRASLKHTLHIFVFILVFNLAMGFAVELIGQENFSAALQAAGWWQPALAGLIGLIPNCVASVLLTQLFVGGQISFGACVAGLCTSAGVGLAVLVRANPSWKQNLFIVGLLYVLGVSAGMLCQLFA